MGTLLKVIGGGWALLGVLLQFGVCANVQGSDETRGGAVAFGLVFAMLVFILPGLVLAGIGALVSKKQAKAAQ